MMVKTYISYNKNPKKKENLKISIKIKWNRCDFRHTTNLIGNLDDLKCINSDGSMQARVKRPSAITLQAKLIKEIRICKEILDKIPTEELSKENFERAYAEYTKKDMPQSKKEKTFLDYLEEYKENGCNGAGSSYKKHFSNLVNSFRIFLLIEDNESLNLNDFTYEMAEKFREYFKNEYLYVTNRSYAHLYEYRKVTPKEQHSENYTAHTMGMLKTFLCYMDDEEILSIKNPLTTKKGLLLCKESYGEPFVMNEEEFKTLKDASVDKKYQETKDAFLFQCATGLRINEFQNLSKENICVSENGIPYISYVPSKTIKFSRRPKQTPLVRYAFDIWKNHNFEFSIIKYPSGKSGYNAKLKKLFTILNLTRKHTNFDENGRPKAEYLNEEITNHFARRYFDDTFEKQERIGFIGSGIHSEGSGITRKHYSDADSNIEYRFVILNMVFKQKPYKVDENLEYIEE